METCRTDERSESYYSEFTPSELAGKRLDKGDSRSKGVGSIVLGSLVSASEDFRARLDQLILECVQLGSSIQYHKINYQN
ncbi:hypothetical protein POVCU2_0092150 [Plasmodium ovale curtisi]|uniref:Uncharacterized protein n=1 Tax=Plasmodium ovale curtisi TaxID=864141 RepID=A0A1A8WPZ4_PLAOA|nr:hypothetical protein POVCU2_0092150 [Plasmodium ovale curtisi]